MGTGKIIRGQITVLLKHSDLKQKDSQAGKCTNSNY